MVEVESSTVGDPGGSPDPGPRLEIMPGLPWREVGDRIIVFDRSAAELVEIAGPGAAVWTCIATSPAEHQLRALLSEILRPDTLELRAAQQLVDQFIERGLVRRA